MMARFFIFMMSLTLVACGEINISIVRPGSISRSPTPEEISFKIEGERFYFLTNHNIDPIVPVINSGNNIQFTISPALPTGLSLDPETGVISGNPTLISDDVSYTLTATNSLGSVSAEVKISSLDGFIVDVNGDQTDDNPADMNCFSTAAGGCTLRAAIVSANANAGKQLIILNDSPIISSAITNTDDLIIAAGTSKNIRPAVANSFRFLTHNTPGKNLTLFGLDIRNFGTTASSTGVIYTNTANEISVFNSHFEDNRSNRGGVFYIYAGAKALIRNSIFVNNQATNHGGVIDGGGASTDIIIQNVYAEGNRGSYGSFAHICTGTTSTVENTTLYGNTATSHGVLAVCTGKFILNNVTIVGNTSTGTGVPGIYLDSSSSNLDISNSLIAHNFDNSSVDRGCRINSGAPIINSFGGNIFSGPETNCVSRLHPTLDLFSTDPLVVAGPGQMNGGIVPTILLEETSPALDSGINLKCPLKDARGVERFFDFLGSGNNCDVGAVEMTY